LKMSEFEVVARVTRLAARQRRTFRLIESTSLRQLQRLKRSDGMEDLTEAYTAPQFA
jgi:hypothetical protein